MADAIQLSIEPFTARHDHPFSESKLKWLLDRLPPLATQGPWCSGGAVRRTIEGKSLDSDLDFFFADAEQMDRWKASLPEGLREIRKTEHHTHFRGQFDGDERVWDVQAIHFQTYPDMAALIDSFDFTICQFATDGETLVTTPEALFDLGRRRLAVHRITYPVATMRRLLKYGTQGFTACRGCMAEILRQTANNPDALSQLGVEYVD